jgi:hypothetical protein
MDRHQHRYATNLHMLLHLYTSKQLFVRWRKILNYILKYNCFVNYQLWLNINQEKTGML